MDTPPCGSWRPHQLDAITRAHRDIAIRTKSTPVHIALHDMKAVKARFDLVELHDVEDEAFEATRHNAALLLGELVVRLETMVNDLDTIYAFRDE